MSDRQLGGVEDVSHSERPSPLGSAQVRHQVAPHHLMKKLLRIASPLGLLAEEFDTDTGRHLGNFPPGVLASRLDRRRWEDHRRRTYARVLLTGRGLDRHFSRTDVRRWRRQCHVSGCTARPGLGSHWARTLRSTLSRRLVPRADGLPADRLVVLDLGEQEGGCV